MTTDGGLNFTQERRIALPPAGSDEMIGIRKEELAMLKQRCERLKRPLRTLPIWYSILFGIAGTGFASIIPLSVTDDLAAWVVPVYLTASILLLVFGLALLLIDSVDKRSHGDDVDTLIEEVQTLQQRYEPENVQP